MTQQLEGQHVDPEVSRVGLNFGVGNATRVYRKLQCGDNRSAIVSIPSSWTKDLKDSKLCGYVRLNRNPDGSILLEFE